MSRRIVEVTRQGRVGSDGLSNLVGVVTTAVDASVVNADSGKAYRCTAALTLTLPAATSPGWSLLVEADGGDVTLASTMTVNGSASIVLADGTSCQLYSDGSAIFALFFFSDAGGTLINYAALAGATFTGAVTIPTLSLTNALAVAQGGTGAADPATARNNLDVYAKSEVYTQAHINGNFYTAAAVDANFFRILSVNTISSASGTAYVVPNGGTWLVYAQQFSAAGANAFTQFSGIVAGGTSLGAPGGGFAWTGFALKIRN